MTASDQEIISRFPVGYYQLHPNAVLNFEFNRFWDWVGEEQMLTELRAAAPSITNYADWVKVMLELSDKALADGRRLPAASTGSRPPPTARSRPATGSAPSPAPPTRPASVPCWSAS